MEAAFEKFSIIAVFLLAGCSKEAAVTKQDDSEGEESVQTENRMILTINGQELMATLADNIC